MSPNPACNSPRHFNRRTALQALGLSGLGWLTPAAQALARAAEKQPRGKPARSLIVIWLDGGPSQLDTFDPHPKSSTGGDVKARKTRAAGVQLADGFERLADQMDHVAVLRSVVSQEGDHARAAYNMKTGYRPDPTVTHPAIGAILCHQLPAAGCEIPRHISILPGRWRARGGYLGDKYDSFAIGDPARPIPDVAPRVPADRDLRRLADLKIVEQTFARGRLVEMEERRTLHRTTIAQARRMMGSEQLKAFDVTSAPASTRAAFGETTFGRACLAAARLTAVGVPCVEVTLGGWDSHINNRAIQRGLVDVLDPALAALIDLLQREGRLDHTLIMCGGEFGRTPRVNGLGGRDHWPHGFSLALAGGGIRGGRALGETDPAGGKIAPGHKLAIPVADVHATVLRALGVDFEKEMQTPIGRPLKLSEGRVIPGLLATN